MMEAPESNGERAAGLSRLTGREWLVLLMLGAVQFTHVLDFMIVMPLGPQYMDKTKMALTTAQFGNMVSAYAFSACISGLFAAWFIDYFDRKTALLVLYGGFAVGTLCCAIAPNYLFLVAARIVTGGFGGVVNATVLAIIGDLFHDSRRGRAMGVIMSAFSLASIAGVPAGLILAEALGWQAPFACLAVISVVVLLGAFAVLPSVRGHLGRTHQTDLGRLIAIVLDGGHLRAYALMSFLVLGMFTIFPFMATYLVRNVGCAETDLKYMYFFGGAVTLVTMQGIGWLADRVSKLWLFRILAVCTVVPILLVTNLPRVSLPVMLLCMTLFMAVSSARMVPLMALVTACAQPRLRGSFMSVSASVQQMAMGLAAQVAGMIVSQEPQPLLGTPVAGAIAAVSWDKAFPAPLVGFPIVGLIAATTTLGCAYFVGHLRPVVIPAAETDVAGHAVSPQAGDAMVAPESSEEIAEGRFGAVQETI
jgi:DHA1 family inner membrane transport protein